MKLEQLFEKEADLSEIDSKYFWNIKGNAIERVSLSTFAVDMSRAQPPSSYVACNLMPLPNDQIFGMSIKESNATFQNLFIADKNFNIKPIETPILKHDFKSCFYDGSIYIFQDDFEDALFNSKGIITKKYKLSENRWTTLARIPSQCVVSCIGFNQKIIVSLYSPGIWIYDLLLNSYSRHYPIENSDDKSQILYKISGKIYLITLSVTNKIYSSDDPLADWNFLCEVKENLRFWRSMSRAYHESAFYFLKDSAIFEFSMKEFKLKEIK